MPHQVDHLVEVFDIYFAEQVKVYKNEPKSEVVKTTKNTTVKAILAPFKKDKKKLNVISTPSDPKTVVKKGESVTVNWEEKVHAKDENGKLEYDYPKINKIKVGKKLFIVAKCSGDKAKLTIEIFENNLTNAESVYDNPFKFLIGEEEKTKIEFNIKSFQPDHQYEQEITLKPKSKEEYKKLIDKFNKRKDKNAFLYLKADVTDTISDINFVYENREFQNIEGNRFEVLGTPCYCNRDLSVDEIKSIVSNIRDNTFYYDSVAKKDYSITHYHKDKLFYLESSLPNSEKNNYEKFTEVLNKSFGEFKINTCIRKINFLAQMYPETMFFTDLSENNPSSDLRIYYGRGFIQLTHKGDEDSRTKNATSYLGYKKYSNLDVIATPNLICESLENSANTAGWFWRFGKRSNDGSIKDLNTLADIDDANEISRLVNGGTNARKERLEANKQLKKIFIYDECINKI